MLVLKTWIMWPINNLFLIFYTWLSFSPQKGLKCKQLFPYCILLPTYFSYRIYTDSIICKKKLFMQKHHFLDDYGRKYQFVILSKDEDPTGELKSLASFPTTKETVDAIKLGEMDTILEQYYYKKKDKLISDVNLEPSATFIPYRSDRVSIVKDLTENLVGFRGGSAWFKVQRKRRNKSQSANSFSGDNEKSYFIPVPNSGVCEVSFFEGNLKAICTKIIEPKLAVTEKGYSTAKVLLNFID